MPTTIILADDHHLVRKAFKMLLQAEAGLNVIAEGADGMEAIELAEKKLPNLLLLDLALPRATAVTVDDLAVDLEQLRRDVAEARGRGDGQAALHVGRDGDAGAADGLAGIEGWRRRPGRRRGGR